MRLAKQAVGQPLIMFLLQIFLELTASDHKSRLFEGKHYFNDLPVHLP